MTTAKIGKHEINYSVQGDAGAPLITFVNGLTQSVGLWTAYSKHFAERGYRVLAYDMLGQGRSSKPVLSIVLEDQPRILAALLDHIGAERTFLAAISFGGIVAIDFALAYGERLDGLVLMSTFADLTPQLEFLGAALYEGLTQVGLPYLQSLLYPMNLSGAWIAANRERIPEMKRAGYIGNDLYALQNLMESFVKFTPRGPRLHEIECPTLILNGEYDFFTPRECHDLMRREICNSRLVLMQRAYHAFTLEMPALTMRQIEHFVASVRDGSWSGDQSVWVAAESADAEPCLYRALGDHMRAIPPYEVPANAAAGSAR
jgi:pimeloyl-ACP methyl ester carboxylesterase